MRRWRYVKRESGGRWRAAFRYSFSPASRRGGDRLLDTRPMLTFPGVGNQDDEPHDGRKTLILISELDYQLS